MLYIYAVKLAPDKYNNSNYITYVIAESMDDAIHLFCDRKKLLYYGFTSSMGEVTFAVFDTTTDITRRYHITCMHAVAECVLG